MSGRVPMPDLDLLPYGDRAVAVYDRLRLADVPGTPSLAEASGPWFREIVRAMFGAYDPVAKRRLIRELFLLVPKKNSKTTYGALGLMLVALLLNERPRAPFLMTAPVQDVADLAFSAVAGAIALDPVLDAKLHVREHLKTIVHRETKATLEIITFDPKVVTGKKVVGALIDEVHVLGKMARADKALLQLRGGMQPFPEAFLAMITTQSDEAPAGVFRDELINARAVRDGQREGALLPVLYEFPAEMQQDRSRPWEDPKNWPMVTPNMGLSITADRLLDSYRQEAVKGERALRTWASQHLDIEIGLALSADGWTGADYWEQNGQQALTLEEVIATSDILQFGIDGGGLDDMLGVCVMGRHEITGVWQCWHCAWIHEVAIVRRQASESLYRDFAAAGDLVILPDDSSEDVEAVAAIAEQLRDSGRLDKIGVDAVGIQAIVDALAELDLLPGEHIVAISQGWKLNGAIKNVERKLAAGQMVHGGGALMAWCVGNCKVVQVGNAITITKQASGTAKIDPVMATFNAASLMALAPEANVYGEDRELTVV